MVSFSSYSTIGHREIDSKFLFPPTDYCTAVYIIYLTSTPGDEKRFPELDRLECCVIGARDTESCTAEMRPRQDTPII